MTNSDQAPIVQSKPPIVVLRERLEARAGELKAALAEIPPQRFIRAVITAAQINPDILACQWNSVWLACMKACRDGLLPDGVEGAIVAYGDKANWIPMYRGLLRKFQESGSFKWIGAEVVREGEFFEYWLDTDGPHLKHVPNGMELAPIIKVYAMATTLQGGKFVAVLHMPEIDKIKKMSRAKREDAPWRMWESEMMKKTALRRLAKMLPSGRIADEDDDDADEVREDASPLRAAAVSAPRERTAAAALDMFASSSGSDSVPAADNRHPDTAAPEEGDGAQQPHHESAGAQPDQRSAGPATAAVASTEPGYDPVTVAYLRGKEAKAAKHERKALPGEYRSSERDAEATAWLAGYDGKPKP
jgi:recombination protein RecT